MPLHLLLGFITSTTLPSGVHFRLMSAGMSLKRRYSSRGCQIGPSVKVKPVPSCSTSTFSSTSCVSLSDLTSTGTSAPFSLPEERAGTNRRALPISSSPVHRTTRGNTLRGRKASAAVAAAAITLVCAAVANSAGVIPGKSAFLGGGSIEAKYRPGFHPKLAWINLAVSKNGKTVTAYGDWNASCTGFGPPARASFTTKPFTPRADGSFVAVGDLSPSNTAGHYALTRRFTSSTSATGTGQS